MRRIDAVMKILKVDYDFYDLFGNLFDDGLNGIFEIFVCLEEIKGNAYVLLDTDIFSFNLLDNLQNIFENEEEYTEFINYVLTKQPDLNEEIDKEDILELCMNLADVESARYNTYSIWHDRGVVFEVADTNLIIDLIEELLGHEVSSSLFDYASGYIDEDQLRIYFKDRLLIK